MMRADSILRATILAAFVLAGAAAVARAQEDPHAACAAPPAYIPADLLQRPVALRSGAGNSHEPVTTTSAEAQAFYDQGLNYLESYVWLEAARSFHQALRHDPALAMAWVGLSRVDSGLDNPDGAKRALEKAKMLSPGVSDRERRRIELRDRQLAAIDKLGDVAAHAAYKKAIDDALVLDLEDPQLWLLRGNAEEATPAGRGQRGSAASVAFYEQVLRLAPDHATAHHYLIHSYETIGRIDMALVHGEAYARLAPSIPHAAHMYGHDLRRIGRLDEAIARFETADSLERAYYKAEGIDPSFDWHHGHNLDLLGTCYQHKGQMKRAERTVREAAGFATPDAYGAYRKRELPSFLIHRARYEEAIEAVASMTVSSHPQARAVGHALRGQALLGLGRLEEAAEALEAARKDLEAVPVVTAGIVANRGMVEPWVGGLEGELLLRTGRMQEGREILKAIQAGLRATPGPDAWIQTLFRLETIARSARDAGDWELAEYTAGQMLDHDAAYGGSHLAMALVLRHNGDAAGAAREFEAARRAWSDADKDLSELREMAAALAGASDDPSGGGR
ncbi:MAG TPA: tetratricopeptide repeat protein [Candidatus Polarisedimenticolia bacterium]|nr:tetratricopeptide repeat protein [Candidatus Polarisedimenticolia bacterium]